MPLLEVAHVRKTFRRSRTLITAVNDVSFEVEIGETLGIIGESGSGKSTLGRIAVGLIQPDNGVVRFDNINFSTLSARDLRATRSQIQVVFQEPQESLNPRMRALDIVQEPMEIHRRDLTKEQRRDEARGALHRVGLREDLWHRRPAQLSGGEQQRVGIARAIVSHPRLLLLDEPTSSLDLSLRAGILQLLLDLQAERQLTYVFVSHDMTTIEYLSTRIAVMYKGRIVEDGPAARVVNEPAHPYTQQLVAARLPIDPRRRTEAPSAVPVRDVQQEQTGCVFYSRCPIAVDTCSTSPVPFVDLGNGHRAACLRIGQETTANGKGGNDRRTTDGE
jgi:peptide/nickel transport system ATP-binding protein/oligopeptide transport system ATP-binding protein